MPSIEEITKALRPIFDGEPVYRAVLFSSVARGTATQGSDADMMLDSRGELIGLGFFRVLEQIASALNCDVDVIETSQIMPGSPFGDALKSEGVVIYDRKKNPRFRQSA